MTDAADAPDPTADVPPGAARAGWRVAPGLGEPARLAALRRLALLDSRAEEAFDRLTRLVTTVLTVPVSLVTLVEEDRQFFKSCIGLPEPWGTARETPLSHSFCQHVVSTGEALVIEDARAHPLVLDNLAIADLGVVAYAGIPLVTQGGHFIGSFCAIDHQPRRWTPAEIGVLRDLAASVMTEIELRSAIRERDELLAVVAHDLRNPLYGILMAASLGLRPGVDPERRARQLASIKRTGERMNRLIGDLLDIGGIEQGSLVVDLRPHDVAPLVAEACEPLEAVAAERGVRLACAVADGTPAVHADQGRLLQALGNLLDNAVRVTPTGGLVTLRAERADGGVAFTVTDEGPGIPADDLPHLFERFWQGSQATRGRAGLGLTIARGVAQAHGGALTVRGGAGGGTAFRLVVPARSR